jgi:hypothetical protein
MQSRSAVVAADLHTHQKPDARAAGTAFVWSLRDWCMLAAALGFAVVVLHLRLHSNGVPFEDAAMLMRYADHLGHGHGITWNVGEKPVDGATDFLFMCLLAGLVKLGIAIERATLVVVVGSHLATVALLYVATRALYRLTPTLALLPALYLAAGPAAWYIDAYFGTPFFAFFAALTWCLALLAARRPASRITAAAFSLSGLTLALIRPEGTFLAVLMLAALIYRQGMRQSRTVLTAFVMAFALVGAAYFMWRWHYFGYPLPNPFYKKGGGRLYGGSLVLATKHMVRLAYPVVAVLAVALGARRARREAVFALIPLAGFIAIWVLLSNEMNYKMRFQYPVLPVALLAWPPALLALRKVLRIPGSWSELAREQQVTLRWAAAVAVIGILSTQLMLYRGTGSIRDGRYAVALALRRYQGKSYTLATTEAGILPLYSGWRAVDAWGLNDQWIAHHGRITPDYLQRYRPEVIVAHGPLLESGTPAASSWGGMVRTLRRYAEQNRYQLAAAYGETPYDVHLYYVRTDFADGEEIVRRIRSLDYAWYATGRTSINYALLPGLTVPPNPRR